MTPEEFDEIVQRYLSGSCTPREKKLVEDWFINVANDNQVHLDDLTKQAIRKGILSKLKAQIGIDTSATAGESSIKRGARTREPLIKDTSKKEASRRDTFRRVLRYAASLAFLIAAWYLIRSNFTSNNKIGQTESIAAVSMLDVVNETSTVKEVHLKDGSTVSLAPGSKVHYPEDFQLNREVHLDGEAFFLVTKDKEHPFYVYAGNVVTRVVGTSFRVNASDKKGTITVSVKNGKVSVYPKEQAQSSSDNTHKLMLSPNQEAVYDPVKEELSQRIVAQPELIPDTPDLKMKFVNAPAANIFDALEKAYGIDLQFNRDAFAGCTLTTDLSEEGFYQRIDALCHALNAEYEVTEASVIIKSNGCN